MNDTEEINSKKQSLIDHLEELRIRLIKSLICVVMLCLGAYFASLPAIEWMKASFCPELPQLVYIHPMELFFTRLKVALFMAVFTGFPYISFQIWQFISPAMFKKEQKYVLRFALISTFLFISGGAFALFCIYPAVIKFSMSMASSDIVPMINVQSFVNLGAMLMLGFGLMFQLPIFVFILVAAGLTSADTMAKCRPVIIVVVFVLSAILTPPDVISQLAMGIPTLLLFEVSLAFAKIAFRKKRSGKN